MSARMGRKTSIQLDQIKATLGGEWGLSKRAGTLDEEIDLTTAGRYGCAAVITMDDGTTYDGAFSSDGLHAEMDALQNVVAGGGTLAKIATIEIEKEPCPRCAVALNKLALAGKTTFKAGGQKDYPTWRYPKVGVIWSVQMGIATKVSDTRDSDELLGYFNTQKWW